MTSSAPPEGRPLRIAHIIQNLNYGGMERVLHTLARQLPRRGFEIHIVVLEYLGHFAQGLEGAATLLQVPPMSKLSLLYPTELVSVLRKIAPDLVHTHSGVWLKGMRAARLAGVRHTVHTDHGRPDPVPLHERVIDNWASRLTSVIVAVSETLAEVLRRSIVSDPAKVRVITNGVELESRSSGAGRDTVRKELGIPDGATVIGSIGRLEPVKNYGLAIRAFAQLHREAPADQPLWLLLAGDGSERAALEELARSLGVSDRVRFLGWRNDTELLYPAFDIFTLSSRSEGTSISLLEAMTSGVCPVVTDVGGNRSVLGPELASLVVPEDAGALATAWRRCAQDPRLRSELAGRARHRVETAFSAEHMVEQYAGLYRQLCVPAGR
jgi:glycosyltransferase involved in cell wall biosynthesis